MRKIGVVTFILTICLTYAEVSSGDSSSRQIDKQAMEYYVIAKQQLQEGSSTLASGKAILDDALRRNNVSLISLRELFEDDFRNIKIPLTTFFDTLYKKYRCQEVMTAEHYLTQETTRFLSEAKKTFHEASMRQPNFVDAYLYESITCIKMGWHKEAIQAFKQVLNTMTDNQMLISPLDEDVTYIFREITRISMDYLELLDETEIEMLSSENVIGKLMSIRKNYINKLKKNALEDKEIDKLKNVMIKNEFELAKFYSYSKEKVQAISAFNAAYKNVQKELTSQSQIYNNALEYIKSLKKEIEELQGVASISFKVHRDVLAQFKPTVKFKLVKKNKQIACYDNLSIVLSPENSGVTFMDEWTYDESIKNVKIIIPPGEYLLQLDFLNLEIIKEDNMPCVLMLKNNKKSLRLQPDVLFGLNDNLKKMGGETHLVCNKYRYDKNGFIIDKYSGQNLEITTGSAIERMIMPELSFNTEEESGEYVLILDRIGNWTVTGKNDVINMPRSGGIIIMLVLFLTVV